MARTELYRAWGPRGTLLYVGISLNMLARLRQHRASARWFRDCIRLTITRYPSRPAAIAAERDAIQRERPLFNIVNNLPRRRIYPGEVGFLASLSRR